MNFVGTRLFLGVRIGFAGPSTHFYSVTRPRVAHLPAFGYGMHPWNRNRVHSDRICSLGLMSSKTLQSSKEYVMVMTPPCICLVLS